MSETASSSTGIAGRYASAVFDLARDAGQIDGLASDVETLTAALAESDDLRALIHSPLYSREDQERAIGAVAEKMGLSDTLRNTLRLMASKRRLFVVPALLRALRARIAAERGEVTADVTTAQPLSDAQRRKLAETLKGAIGQDVNIQSTVDESLIGGLVVKVGSRMIDTSIKTKLAQLQNTMKEAR